MTTSRKTRVVAVVDRSHLPFILYYCDILLLKCFSLCLSVLGIERLKTSYREAQNRFRVRPYSAKHAGGSIARRHVVSVRNVDVNADRRRARNARIALFCMGDISPSYSWILAYVEFERRNIGQHFLIRVISKLASGFLPDDAIFMAAFKRSPYHSYDCYVSVPFRSVGIVSYNLRRMCPGYGSHPDHVRYSGAFALETFWMVMIVVSVLLSTPDYWCSTCRRDSSRDRSYEVG